MSGARADDKWPFQLAQLGQGNIYDHAKAYLSSMDVNERIYQVHRWTLRELVFPQFHALLIFITFVKILWEFYMRDYPGILSKHSSVLNSEIEFFRIERKNESPESILQKRFLFLSQSRFWNRRNLRNPGRLDLIRLSLLFLFFPFRIPNL